MREFPGKWMDAISRVRAEYPALTEQDDHYWRLTQAIYQKLVGGLGPASVSGRGQRLVLKLQKGGAAR